MHVTADINSLFYGDTNNEVADLFLQSIRRPRPDNKIAIHQLKALSVACVRQTKNTILSGEFRIRLIFLRKRFIWRSFTIFIRI